MRPLPAGARLAVADTDVARTGGPDACPQREQSGGASRETAHPVDQTPAHHLGPLPTSVPEEHRRRPGRSGRRGRAAAAHQRRRAGDPQHLDGLPRDRAVLQEGRGGVREEESRLQARDALERAPRDGAEDRRRDPHGHGPRSVRRLAQHRAHTDRRESPATGPPEGDVAPEEQRLPPGDRRVQHVEGAGLRRPVPGGLEAGALLQHEDVQGGRARPQQAAGDLRRAHDLRAEAHEAGRRRQPDARRHHAAAGGPGLGRRREVLVRALRHGRRSAHPDQVGQVAQQLRQRRRARGHEVLHRRRSQAQGRRPEAAPRHQRLRQRAGGDAHARVGRHRDPEGEGTEGRVHDGDRSREGPSAGAA